MATGVRISLVVFAMIVIFGLVGAAVAGDCSGARLSSACW